MAQPTLFVIAGPNGAGKSTLYYHKIKHHTPAPFINADEIQLSLKGDLQGDPYQAAKMAACARERFIRQRQSFVTESVFSHPSKLVLIRQAKAAGFRIVLFHVHVAEPDISVNRVKKRVAQGGHTVPETKTRERYTRNQAIIHDAALIADITQVFDNSYYAKQHQWVLTLKQGVVTDYAESIPRWARDIYRNELPKSLRPDLGL